jgi:hypothetical protein
VKGFNLGFVSGFVYFGKTYVSDFVGGFGRFGKGST